MLQQKFIVQVTTLPDCDDITRFDGTYTSHFHNIISTQPSLANSTHTWGPPSPSLGWVDQNGGFLNKRFLLTIFLYFFLLLTDTSTGRQF